MKLELEWGIDSADPEAVKQNRTTQEMIDQMKGYKVQSLVLDEKTGVCVIIARKNHDQVLAEGEYETVYNLLADIAVGFHQNVQMVPDGVAEPH